MKGENGVRIFNTLKEVVFFEKDNDFFDKEATIKEYFSVCPPNQRKKVKNYDELYIEALKYVSKQNFEENTKNQENYFYEMTNVDAGIAICIGVTAYFIAREVDKKGSEWEGKIDEVLPSGFDKNNPFDTKIGKNHRDFGHDIFSFGLKNIPEDFPIFVDKMGKSNIYLPVGEVLGKSGNISMLDIIWHYYGKGAKNPLAGVFNCAGHTIIHFAKDLLTSEGVPLPFSSLLSYYENLAEEEDFLGFGKGTVVDADDYSLTNKFNRLIDKYKGNMKASDFASLGFIEGMNKLYVSSKKLGDREKSFKRDMKILSMGTCIMLQLSSLILAEERFIASSTKGNMSMVPGAKLNVIMTGALMKNMVQEMGVVLKERHKVNVEYSERLKETQGRKYYE